MALLGPYRDGGCPPAPALAATAVAAAAATAADTASRAAHGREARLRRLREAATGPPSSSQPQQAGDDGGGSTAEDDSGLQELAAQMRDEAAAAAAAAVKARMAQHGAGSDEPDTAAATAACEAEVTLERPWEQRVLAAHRALKGRQIAERAGQQLRQQRQRVAEVARRRQQLQQQQRRAEEEASAAASGMAWLRSLWSGGAAPEVCADGGLARRRSHLCCLRCGLLPVVAGLAHACDVGIDVCVVLCVAWRARARVRRTRRRQWRRGQSRSACKLWATRRGSCSRRRASGWRQAGQVRIAGRPLSSVALAPWRLTDRLLSLSRRSSDLSLSLSLLVYLYLLAV
jgi:hypothetical protein